MDMRMPEPCSPVVVACHCRFAHKPAADEKFSSRPALHVFLCHGLDKGPEKPCMAAHFAHGGPHELLK